ncbi:MAG: hypothetical protein Q4F85_06225 [Prevotella sp.]|nr:hypothetical protein [Prevotella sp.]
MEITRQRLRKVYAPLSAAVSMRVLTSGSPLAQVFDGEIGTYNPNRELTATVILPEITLSTTDGSLESPYGNSMLAEMKWLVNNKEISTVTEFQGKYEILTAGSTRGALRISYNVPINKTYSIRFEGVIADNRTGSNVPIKTDSVILSTIDRAKSAFSLSSTEDAILQYCPIKDKLLLYEHKVSHGLIGGSPAELATAKADESAYLRKFPLVLYEGPYERKDYTVKLYEINEDKTFTEITADDVNEIRAIEKDGITIDLRMVDKKDYLVKAYADGSNVCDYQFSVNRLYPKYTVRSSNGTSIAPTDVTRYDKAMVDCEGNIVECPGLTVYLLWKTQSIAGKVVTHNEGEATLYMLSSTGIGNTYDNDSIDQFIETEYKDKMKIVVNENGEYLMSDGKYLICN